MRALVLAAATYADPSTRRMFDHIAAKGIEIMLAMPRRIQHPFGPSQVPDTPWPTPGVRLERLETYISHENGTHIIMKGVPRLIREFHPDIIHCVMEPWSLTCLQVAARIATMAQRPKFGIQAAETMPEQGGALNAFVRRFLFRRVLARSDYLVGWNKKVIRVAATLGLNGQPTCVAPAVGTDTSLFRPAAQNEKQRLRAELGLGLEGEFLVGFVGRFAREKGIEDLLSAMDVVVRNEPLFRLLLLGAGPLEDRLHAAAASRPWMRCLGRTDPPGVARFMRSLDLLALPSRTTPAWEEQFGLVLVEAMASGVPAVGSTCGVIPEVIGEAGWIFEEGDLQALENRIRGAARDPEATLAKGTAARRRVESLFSCEAVAASLLQTWREVT